MKIKFGILILVFTLLFCSCEKFNAVSIGMTHDEFYSFMEGKDVFSYGNYAFWSDENGNDFVAEFSSKELKIIRIEHFSRQDKKPTSDDFKKITAEMDMFNVVEIVGNPFRTVTSGLATLDFLSNDETVYRIDFDASNGYKVIEVYIVE